MQDRRSVSVRAAAILMASCLCAAGWSSLAAAAPPTPRAAAKAGSTKQHDVVSPGGVILPIALDGGSAWSLKDLYLPGRPPPDVVHARLIVPGEAPQTVRPLVLPHPPGDPKDLVVTRGASPRAVVETLAEHGDFVALRAFWDGPNGGVAGNPALRGPRRAPEGMRARAVELWGPGLRREVKTAAPTGAKDDKGDHVLEERVARVEGGPPSRDPVVNEAYDNTGAVYGFYRSQYGRRSIDDRGAKMTSVVHVGETDIDGNYVPMANANYEKKVTRFGDGDGRTTRAHTTEDVVAHEWTHGVDEMTAKLQYRGESGALNEHFSDVFGQMVFQWRHGLRADQASWTHGRQLALTARAEVKPERSFVNPHESGQGWQPAHVREMVHTTEDAGGVHDNSGIPNRAFYGAATRIGGYAWETAGKIWYVTLRDRLRPDATFRDCARLTVQVAGELFGVGSREQRAVVAGWADVGIFVRTSDPLPPPR